MSQTSYIKESDPEETFYFNGQYTNVQSNNVFTCTECGTVYVYSVWRGKKKTLQLWTLLKKNMHENILSAVEINLGSASE